MESLNRQGHGVRSLANIEDGQERTKKNQIALVLDRAVLTSLESFTRKDSPILSREVQMSMYASLFNSIAEILSDERLKKLKLSVDAVNYIAQTYWITLSVNGSEEGLDDTIFTKYVKVSDLETRELAIIAMMFKGDPKCIEPYEEVKRRG